MKASAATLARRTARTQSSSTESDATVSEQPVVRRPKRKHLSAFELPQIISEKRIIPVQNCLLWQTNNKKRVEFIVNHGNRVVAIISQYPGHQMGFIY